MIERSEFLKLLQRLDRAYVGKLVFTQDLIDLWYDMFKDCNEQGLKLAVDKCIKESEFAPNIAGLMKYYRELETKHNELVDLVKHQYAIMRSIWEEEYDDDTFMELWAYVNRFPEKSRKVEIVELTHRAVSFKHDCEGLGRTDTPTILRYLQGDR